MHLSLQHGKTLHLGHRAYCKLRGSPKINSVLVAAANGQMSICNFAGEPTAVSLRAPCKVQAACIHPNGNLLAVIDAATGGLVILDHNGAVIWRAATSSLLGKTAGRSVWYGSDCWFDGDGRYLWWGTHISEDVIAIEVRETRKWSIVATGTLNDPFGGSAISFHPAPSKNNVSIWLATGDAGQATFWTKIENDDVLFSIEHCLQDTLPPAFSPTGQEFLVTTSRGDLRSLSYPSVGVSGVAESPFGSETFFEYYFAYVDDRYALVMVTEGRLALVKVTTMDVVCEVSIEGHEPRPTEYYYQKLSGDKTLCTDISHFARLGSLFIFVFRADDRSDYDIWRDGLVCYDAEYFAAQIQLQIPLLTYS